jgi:hypothetical protein
LRNIAPRPVYMIIEIEVKDPGSRLSSDLATRANLGALS